MNIAAICFTKNGYKTIKRLNSLVKQGQNDIELKSFCKCSALRDECDISYVNCSIEEWTNMYFTKDTALLFVGAVGIAVRAIAPLVASKLTDSPVLVMDDEGQYVIPILSGHVGGANELARKIAYLMNSQAVITTSTDIHNKFAIDLFAKNNMLNIVNKDGIAKVSAKVLSGEKISILIPSRNNIDVEAYDIFLIERSEDVEFIFMDEDHEGENADVIISGDKVKYSKEILRLEPREYVIGIGCKKGKSKEEIKRLVVQCLDMASIDENQLIALASIDIKKEEAGIIQLAGELGIDFLTFSSDELDRQQGTFSESSFVMSKVGVGNVCERAAVAACDAGGKIVLEKQASDGVTVAIAKREWRLSFNEE